MAGRTSSPTGFNAYAAGDKKYGTGRGSPNLGPTSDPTGYAERNLQIKARQNALLRRMKANQGGKVIGQAPIMPSNSLTGGI